MPPAIRRRPGDASDAERPVDEVVIGVDAHRRSHTLVAADHLAANWRRKRSEPPANAMRR